MNIEAIPLIRAAYLNVIVDELKEYHLIDEMSLQHFNLPATPANKPDAYVSLNAAFSLMHWGVYGTGIKDLGLLTGERLKIFDFAPELRETLLRTTSLKVALQSFCRLAEREQSQVHYRIEHEQDKVRVCSSLDTHSTPEAEHCGEWLQIMSLLTVIRHYAGNDWTPTTIAFRSRHVPGEHARQTFPHTHFLTGQEETAIGFPASLLKLECIRHEQPHHTVASNDKSHALYKINNDFPTSLQQLLQAYLDDGYPDIKLAAKIVGCSVRTLQRRLKHFDVNYTDLMQQARFEIATNLLKEPGTKVIDAAQAVGYEDPSHFARAFKRLLGVSPQRYRTLNYAQ